MTIASAPGITFTPATEPPEGATVHNVNGILLGAVFLLQCTECSTPLIYETDNPDSLDQSIVLTGEVECPTCTRTQGKHITIAVAAVAGEQVDLIDVEDVPADNQAPAVEAPGTQATPAELPPTPEA